MGNSSRELFQFYNLFIIRKMKGGGKITTKRVKFLILNERFLGKKEVERCGGLE